MSAGRLTAKFPRLTAAPFLIVPAVAAIHWSPRLIQGSVLAQSSVGPSGTYHLEAFGGLALGGGGPRSLSHQRLRLALLALLAASGERGLSRDQIVGYLWPDAENSSARHSLEQLLHALRRRSATRSSQG